MPCNRPLPAWRAKAPNDSGKVPVVFNFQQADSSQKLEIPCGRCTGCRLERARNWAIRMLHEAKLYKDNWFITLTYEEGSLPRTVQGLPTLRPEDFTLFMKRLRKHYSCAARGEGPTAPSPRPLPHGPTGPETPLDNRIRFYQCGEYGEQTARPHHHAIMFNLPLHDLAPITYARTKNAHALYKSPTLERLWRKGHVTIGKVTFETAAYVAAYVTKKISGPMAQEHYQGRLPEYSTMSRRPGIGAAFAAKYQDEIYTADSVIIRGLEMKPPKFYDSHLERRDPQLYYEVRDRRARAPKHVARWREREAREVIQHQRLTMRDTT